MLIPIFVIAAAIGTMVLATHSSLPWLEFWEHIGDTPHDTKQKSQ